MQIARCAVEHRAALQMSFYEGPSSTPSSIELTKRPPSKIQAAMLQALRAGRWSGYIRSDLDLPTLADRMCQSMLHVGLDVIRHKASTDELATLKSRIALEGLAVDLPTDADLDKSNAFAAAEDVIESWVDTEDDSDLKAAHVRAVARAEFGRRGYEMTTIRDIASAAGLGTGTVYRVIGSKDELLMSIMLEFGHKVGGAWTDIVRSDSTTVEKLDALSWLNINALDQFPDEFRIQLAWLRHTPPDTSNPAWSFTTRIRQMKALLSEGIRAGEIRNDSPAADAAGPVHHRRAVDSGEHPSTDRHAKRVDPGPRHHLAGHQRPRQVRDECRLSGHEQIFVRRRHRAAQHRRPDRHPRRGCAGTPSLCAGWDVKTVAAHLVSVFADSFWTFQWAALRHGGFDRAIDELAPARRARDSAPTSHRTLRQRADHRLSPPVTGPLSGLTDVLVHSGDIRIPLGLAVPSRRRAGDVGRWTS